MTQYVYDRIEFETIEKTATADPLKAMLMIFGNAMTDEAIEQDMGKQHVPTMHDAGWSMALKTPRGYVCLWSCWLENQFYLGYPVHETIPNSLIMDTLYVELADAVDHVSATVVRLNADGTCKSEYADCCDPQYPLDPLPSGTEAFAYQHRGLRRWARFYGPQLRAEDGSYAGRVWVETNNQTHGHHFNVLLGNNVTDVYYGHNRSNSVETVAFSFWNKYAVQGPTDAPKAIQPYREKFLRLALKVAEHMGGIEEVHITYGHVVTPVQLNQLGCNDVTVFSDRAYGFRQTKFGTELVHLKRCNSVVPWDCTRRVPWDSTRTYDDLFSLLEF